MVKKKLLQAVDQSGGWLLDGYPRSLSQAEALDALNIRPQLFILLDVSFYARICVFNILHRQLADQEKTSHNFSGAD
jgi:adenylate kinase